MSNLCYKTSNNKYFKCPPRMDDGRHFTDYRPNCHTNNVVRTNNKVNNSFQYRMFLTHNASDLMELNNKYSCQKNCCGSCANPSTMLPESTKVTCNKFSCTSAVNDSNGLGQGRNYGNDTSGGWEKYFSNDMQQCNCCNDTKGLFDYYGDMAGKGVLKGGDPSQDK